MSETVSPYRTGVHISIHSNFKEFHTALKIVAARENMRMGDYLYHLAMKDEKILKELKELKDLM